MKLCIFYCQVPGNNSVILFMTCNVIKSRICILDNLFFSILNDESYLNIIGYFFFYWKYNVENMINQIICVYSDNGKKLILKC